MAKIYQGILGGFEGTVGPVIGYRWKNIWCTRRKPTQVCNPRTERQMAHRHLFGEMVHLAGRLRPALKVGLRQRAADWDMTEGNAFVHMNWRRGARPGYRDMAVSYGPVAPVAFATAIIADNRLTVSFEKNPLHRQANATDSVHLFVYNASLDECVKLVTVERRQQQASAPLPEGWSGDELHVWGFAEDHAGRCSTSQYIDTEYNEGAESLVHLTLPGMADGIKTADAEGEPAMLQDTNVVSRSAHDVKELLAFGKAFDAGGEVGVSLAAAGEA